MGISANQARLMTLTARQHDLELRAQQISATKMTLSLQSQTEATAYSEALNNYSLLYAAENQWKNNSTYYKVNKDGSVTAIGEDESKTGASTYGSAQDLVNAVATRLGISTGSSANVFLEKKKGQYDAATTALSAKEKMYDMELTQINTEHSAVKTEYDSIKSLVSDNVDKSFNVFG